MKQRLESIINKGKILVLASIAALTINCQPLLNQPVKYGVESEVKRQLVWPLDTPQGYIDISIDGSGEFFSTTGTQPPSAGYCIGHDFD